MVAAFLNDGMPTMMSALPSRATSSRSALGRAATGIDRTLAGWPDHRLWQILENDLVGGSARHRMRVVDRASHDVHRELGNVVAGVDVQVANVLEQRRAVGDAKTDRGCAQCAGALDKVERRAWRARERRQTQLLVLRRRHVRDEDQDCLRAVVATPERDFAETDVIDELLLGQLLERPRPRLVEPVRRVERRVVCDELPKFLCVVLARDVAILRESVEQGATTLARLFLHLGLERAAAVLALRRVPLRLPRHAAQLDELLEAAPRA